MDTTPIPQTTPIDTKPPEKYIRTFAGDIEAVKKGWMPNLAPLKKAPPTPIPEQTAVQSSPPPPVQPPPPPPSPIKTYSYDFLQKFKKTNASTATILAAEQDAASGAPKTIQEKPSRGNILYVVSGIALLILGGVGSYIAYTRYLVSVETVIPAPTISAPIFVDEREKISGETSDAILQAIEQSLSRSLAPNTVRLLYTDSATGSTSSPQATTDNSVFSALRLPAPGVLLRNVNASRSMAGIVSAGGDQHPFFILSVASYGDTFAGMLSWESTMPRDMSSLFPSYPPPIATTTPKKGATKEATSTPTVSLFTVFFHDEVVNNHDVRIYRDSEGRSILVYGYWDQATLVIARDLAAFIEILGRLATTRTQP